METLREMVKGIVVIIFMTAFMEIVLPRTEMKRYINLIIGLFVLIAVLNPFLAIINQDFDFSILDNVSDIQGQETASLIKKGQEMALESREKVVSQYRVKMEKQVMALTELYQDSAIERVEVEIAADPADKNYGQVRKIVLWGNGPNGQEKSDPGSKEKDAEIKPEPEIEVAQVEITGNESAEGLRADGSLADGQLSGGQQADMRSGTGLDGLKELIADFYGLNPEQVEIKS